VTGYIAWIGGDLIAAGRTEAETLAEAETEAVRARISLEGLRLQPATLEAVRCVREGRCAELEWTSGEWRVER
jgi:hypothetical protein